MVIKRGRALMATALLTTAFALSGCDGGSKSDDHADGDHDEDTEESGSAGSEVKLKPNQIELAGIKTVEAKSGDIAVELDLTGEVTLNEDNLAHLVARVPGVIRHVYATLGAQVEKGDVLAVLESSELGEAKATYLERKQQLDLALADLNRVRTIHDNTLKMLDFLKESPSSDDLKTLRGLDLGENRSLLISAYSELLATRSAYAREKDLFDKKITSQSELIEAETNDKKAEASLTATRDQLAFAIRRSLLEQRRSHGVAELSLETARRRLLLLGVTEDELMCTACKVDFPLDSQEETQCKACLAARLGLPADEGHGASLARYALKAPFTGTVIEKHLTLGEQVGSEKDLYTLSDLGTVWVIASVYEKDLARVKTAQTARIKVKAYPDRSFGGQVTWVAEVMEDATRTLELRVLVDNSEGLLKPGMFARVALSVETRKDALLVPPAAVQTQKGEAIVFTDEGGGVFERREIQVGVRSATAIEILDGVEVGEKVVTEGSFILKSELEKEGFDAD